MARKGLYAVNPQVGLSFFSLRYVAERHLAKEWAEVTREVPLIHTAAARAATYVNKLKVGLVMGSFNTITT